MISEIHYNPPAGADYEFVELYNPALTAVELGGWRFSAGLQFTFPGGAVVPGRGRVVVARNPSALARRFALEGEREWIFGPCESSLDNGGESLVLVDRAGAVADLVEYDDDAPWDPAADGAGGSLERICLEAYADLPTNWRSDEARGPSPLRAGGLPACPPPALPPPAVAITEVYYHPASDADLEQEFVEIYNNTDFPIDLTGYSFAQGIQFQFAPGAVLGPRRTLVVCRNLAKGRDALGIEGEAVGDFQGQLDNGGERLTLFGPRGEVVDSVRWRDQGDWPVAADGLGRSLERISPEAYGDDPASWTVSGAAGAARWTQAAKTGPATASVLYLYLTGAGEFLNDDVVLESPAQPGVNLLKNGSFEAGLEGWTPAGNHLDSIWEPAGGADGSGALRAVANGRGTAPSNAIACTVDPPLTNGAAYRLAFRYRHLSGEPGMIVRLNGATPTRGLYVDVSKRPLVSPGAANPAGTAVPPFLSHVGRFP
ncbi:MAG: lamin tail domain-containing protein, partial [Thermoanaerobaculia bacterium]